MTPLESWAITPTCRFNRGDDGAWDEAVAQLRQVYDAQVQRFGPTATLTLSIARSKADGISQTAYNACHEVTLRPSPPVATQPIEPPTLWSQALGEHMGRETNQMRARYGELLREHGWLGSGWAGHPKEPGDV